MQPPDLWTMLQLMTRSMRPGSTVAGAGVGGGVGHGRSHPWPSPSPVFPPNQGPSFIRPIAKPPVMPVPVVSKTNRTPFSRHSQCPLPRVFKQTPDGSDNRVLTPPTKSNSLSTFKTDSVSRSQPSISEAPGVPKAPLAAVSKSAVTSSSSSLKQREQDQAWVDDFLRERGYCQAGRTERMGGSEMTSSDRERRKRKKKEWRRRRRLSQGQNGGENPNSSLTTECAVIDGLDLSGTVEEPVASQLNAEVSSLTAEVNDTPPLSELPHRDSDHSFKIVKRDKRREMADLDKLEAKINALEKLRKLRRSAAEKDQSGRDGICDKKLLDELVADSVFDSKLEKLGGWIEKRREMVEKAKS